MNKIYQSIYDPPITLKVNEIFEGNHVIQGGAELGHIIFKFGYMVYAPQAAIIRNNIFERI
jgi:hypothetical protein